MGLVARARFELWRDSVGIWLRNGDEWAVGVTFEKFNKEQAGLTIDPAIQLDMSAAQALMNDLWDCGLRPAQGKQSEGVTAAQARHLEDMRAISFAKLNISPPQTGA